MQNLKKTFRDPNLLIESIRGMQLQQQASIADIKAKLNEITNVREHLKAFNEFKPNLSFDKVSFGKLNLIEYSIDPFKSLILTNQQPMGLIKLCEFNTNDRFNLLYRASRDGFGANNFHSKCDGKANTLAIIKTMGNSYIFGAFTQASWDSSNQYKSDANAFLFSLTNKDNKPCKMKAYQNIGNAICCPPGYGPTFGGGHDFHVVSNANTIASSYSNLGSTYKHPLYGNGTNEARIFLAGSYNFQVSEIEVYQKE
jgi:hypothetical protein